MNISNVWRAGLWILLSVAASGCSLFDDGDDDTPPPANPPPAATYTIGGTAAGLAGGSLVLRLNGGGDLTVSADGAFTFTGTLATGATYTVSVQTAPVGSTCTVANATGTVGSAAVTGVAVTCTAVAPTLFRIGGTVSGLTSGTVVLQVNGGFDLGVSANGPFEFSLQLPNGTTYGVLVAAHPAGQTCNVVGGSGVIPGADVTNIQVQCAASPPPSGNTVFVDPNDVVLDAANNRLLVTDNGRSTIFAIDLTTAARTVFYQSTEIVSSTRTPFFNPVAIDLDTTAPRAVVGSSSNLRKGIFFFALSDAARTTLIDQDSPNGINNFPLSTIAVDGARSRVLAGGNRDEIAAVALGTGALTILSSDATPNATNPLNRVSALALDTLSDRMLASNGGDAEGVYAVDPLTGARTIFSQPGSVAALELDAARMRVLATDTTELVAIALGSGARTVLSNDTIPNGTLAFYDARGMALDGANNRVFVADARLNKIIAVDLGSGTRSVFAESMVPNADLPFANYMAKSIVVDTVNDRILVARRGLRSPFERSTLAVDPATGQRSAAFAADPTRMVFDAANNRVIGVDGGSGIVGSLPSLIDGNTVAVDVTTGTATTLSASALLGFTLDAGRNRIVGLIDTQTIGFIDLSSGVQTVLANSATPGSGVPFAQLDEVVFDDVNGRYLVSDVSAQVIFAIDPTSGARSVFADVQAQMTNPQRIALDRAGNRLLLLDSDDLYGYNLTTGAMTIVSDNATPSLENRFVSPRDMTIDAARNRALVVDEAWGGVLAVDLTTGARTVLSVGVER